MTNTRFGKALAAALGATVLAFCLAGCGSPAVAPSGESGITVTASSETKVVPDKARIRVSVLTEDKAAEACQSKNADSVNAVIEALKGLDVKEESIQTTRSDLTPRYGSRTTSNDAKDDSKDDVAYDEWVVTGYEMNTMLTVSDLEIDNVGAVVQACVAAGANQTDGIEYYASDYDNVYNEALAKALETARGKAEGIASASGVKLGKLVNAVEGYQDTSARYATSYNAMEVAEDAAATGMAKTMPGQIDIEANVTVTYAIS